MDEMLDRMVDAVGRMMLPKALEYGEDSERVAEQVLGICRSRIESFQ
jgi:hypothetical protein